MDWIRVRDLDTGHALTIDSSQTVHGRFERLVDAPAVNELGDPLAPEHGAFDPQPLDVEQAAAAEESGQPVGAVDYEGSTADQLRTEIDRRNADRAEDDQIEPEAPKNKPQLIAALEADDQRG